MEEGTLTAYLETHEAAQLDQSPPRPWYNQYGDCIEYLAESVAVVADRIDGYLTIYRAADTNNPIGFQLKDIKKLMDKYQADFGVIFHTQDSKLISVTSLLLTAFQIEPVKNIKKLSGYEQALKNFSSEDQVCLA
jgi:hypothetical protein